MAGMALSFALAFLLALRKINVTNADTVIESLQQSIKKLKQDGEGNISDLSSTVDASSERDKTKKELRKEKRKNRKQQKKHDS